MMLPGTIRSEKKFLKTRERSTGRDSKVALCDFAVLGVVLFLATNIIANSLCLQALDSLLVTVAGRDRFGCSTASSAVFVWVAEHLV